MFGMGELLKSKETKQKTPRIIRRENTSFKMLIEEEEENIGMRSSNTLLRREITDKFSFDMFVAADAKSTGRLSKEDMAILLVEYSGDVGHWITLEKAMSYVNEITEGNECSYGDFRGWWKRKEKDDEAFNNLKWSPEQIEDIKQIRAKWMVLGSKKDGTLDRKEFEAVYHALLKEGHDFPPFEDCWRKTEGDTIHFDHFIKFIEKGEKEKEPPKLRKKEKTASQFRVLNETSTFHMLKLFRKYDVDKSSGLNVEELRAMCKDLGYILSSEEGEVAIKLLCSRGNERGSRKSEVEFGEFRSWWLSDDRFTFLQWSHDEYDTVKKLSDLYDKYDVTKNGVLYEKEFKIFYEELLKHGFKLPTLRTCMRVIDEDKNKRISFNEFVRFIRKFDLLEMVE